MIPRPAPSPSSPLELTLAWLLRIRWVVWLLQAALVAWAIGGLGMHLPINWLVAPIALGLISNAAAYYRRRAVTENFLLALMGLDVVLHTAVFALTGGPFNPFTILYLVNLVLATLVLSRARQWIQAAASLLGFGSLFWIERFLPSPSHQDLMRLHLGGMWLAFAIAAAFIIYFMQRVLAELARREVALEAARRLAAHHEKLAALTTLAGGAAHELATPLGTIAVAAAELVHALERSDGNNEESKRDAQLIRAEVERCRTILQGMSAKGGELLGEGATSFDLATLLNDAVAPLDERTRVHLPTPALTVPLFAPRTALTQALRNLVRNALDASKPDTAVQIAVAVTAGERLRIDIDDRGAGIAPDVVARIGEPFFTTKAVGQGLGLGVFLARTLVEQLGGSLSLAPQTGGGTRATIVLPLQGAV